MEKTGKYIYGFINSNTALHLFFPRDILKSTKNGVNETSPVGNIPDVANDNRLFNGVYTIPYQDISAVVCDLEVFDYTHIPKHMLAGVLLRHQKVIEKIMSLGQTVIPVRLGTFAADDSEVGAILEKGYGLIKEIVDITKQAIEIDVVVTWADFSSTLKKIGEEEEIKQFIEKTLAGSGEVAIADQMKAGAMIKKILNRKREKYASQIQDVLKKISQDLRIHDLMDDNMVINEAFLVDKSAQGLFDKKTEDLNAGFHDELNFRCIGPLPVYSFYTLQIEKMEFETINWARKKLGLLGSFTDKDEIKKAYRRIAFSSHPDIHPDTPDTEKEFDSANRAYKILDDYCLAAGQAGQDVRCSFDEGEFKKNAILVKVKG